MAQDKVSDELWEEFHLVVNMTSRELTEWLRTSVAGEDAEELPDQAGRSLAHRLMSVGHDPLKPVTTGRRTPT